MRFRKRVPIVLGLILAGAAVAVTAGTVNRGDASAAITPPPSSGCQLANGIKHVVELTFDNVHFNRDNPNVLSDLEQMPALENFITDNGTMLSNNHTPLIAHTADDSLTNYTGLYGDRHGQPLTNSYKTYNSDGTTDPATSFTYWTSPIIDTKSNPPVPNTKDAAPSMVYSLTSPGCGAPNR